ncbi:phage portal protein [Ketogulonicigenium vulgare]|uniref:Putative gene transfer agent portal protein n=1 Tax=Ketogulonicigenium vulgare (strain WSH-001) TaxID=759362 RepID=F9Y453_KETVW|nr:phage portal protein [Ketogulonicigenium vulgare]ADO42294.1 phage portal protein, putative [Ketogulonicigenium vulgare Y25]AEM40489.1 putative gene transfer agent portal protein [Ketogulonicigenium vulgare WSH-001]ALJ80674.1 portal protein [Ketogulonicigenium vulgare]ANW33483.1 phage portal protein [Ketogulonicigenium vulgare]AOZ54206.1 phage portal protein [Ketogulonicigenium vulgare]
MFGFGEKKQPAPLVEVKASAAGKVVGFGTAGRTGFQPREGSSLVRAGFAANPIGFRAVRLISEAASALPLILQDATQRYDTHPVLDLLARPNPAQGQLELFEAIYAQLLLTGNAYVEAVSDGALPTELHVLRSDRMSVVPGPDGWPTGYDYAVAGRKHRFDAAAICHIRAFHPHDDHYGLSPLTPAAAAVEVHNAASRWSRGLLENAARPSGAIVFRGADGNGTLSNGQFDRLVAEMESQHQGARNAGRPMLLEGGLDWKPMGFSPSDMEFLQTKEAAAREIATAFGVPPMLLGIPGDATYANYQEANRAFYRLTVLPLASRVTGALVNWLDDFAGTWLDLRPDPDQIAALQTERDALWARVGAASFLSTAEKRALLGLPGEPDGAA